MAGDKYRHERHARGEALSNLEPDEMRAYLLSHPLSDGGRLWCDRVIEGVARGERTSMRLFSEAMKWTGGQVNIGTLLVQLGAKDEHEARYLITEGKRMEELKAAAAEDLGAAFEKALEVCALALRENPNRRNAIMQLLSGAEEVHHNGDPP